MLVRDLITKLNELNGDLSMMAKIGQGTSESLFIDLFGNSNGIPTMYLSCEKPLPSVKKCKTLLEELEIWAAESIHHQSDSNVYLVNCFDYDDGSYDFRYFKIEDVVHDGIEVLLISSVMENKDLREHFEAFDESMFNPD